MFRTIKVRLIGNIESLVQTATLYTKACQTALDYGFQNKTHSKSKVDSGTYDTIRDTLKQLPSGLVQCARDQACDMLKREKLKTLSTKKTLQVRYDNRTFKFYPESEYVSLSTVNGRQEFQIKVYDYCKQYLTGTYTNAQLVIRKGRAFLNVQCEIEGYPTNDNNQVLGIDRGILNIVTCSDNSFVNSKDLRDVKGRYRYLRAKLQSLGTASARRKLKKLSGAERRFVLDTNHVVSKWIVQKPFGILTVEALQIGKTRSRKFNKLLGSWSYGQLLTLLKYKAEDAGKIIVEIDPRHTSQQCNKCGYIDRKNRKGLKFKCIRCGFELHSDLNGSRNIAERGISVLGRLPVNQPIVTPLAVTGYRSMTGSS